MPLLDLFWASLYIFLLIVWFWLLISIFADIFRSDMSGWAKAAWTIFVIILPFLGILIYLIANGNDMRERSAQQAADYEQAQRAYIQEVAGTGGSNVDELERLAQLHRDGVLTDAEFATEKQKLLA